MHYSLLEWCDNCMFLVTKQAGLYLKGNEGRKEEIKENQRNNGPVNAHLISWPSKAQNIRNLENIW